MSHLSVGKLEGRIESLQETIDTIDTRLADPTVHSDGEQTRQLVTQRQQLVDEMQPLEEEWTRRAEEK